MPKFNSDAVLEKARAKKSAAKVLVENTNSRLPASNLHSGHSALATKNIRRMTAVEIEPSRCKPWEYHNRDRSWLDKDNCSDLISSIQANGQIEPGLVRTIEDPEYDYEVIYGVRRWFACSQIRGQKFLAKTTKENDRTCMILMHIENADSQDISDFERAYSFYQQLQSGSFKSQKDIAEAMNVSSNLISRMIQAAEIFNYDFISDIFPSKKGLPVKTCQILSKLLSNNVSRDRIKKRCSQIGLDGIEIGAESKIIKELIRSGEVSEELDKKLSDMNNIKGLKFKIDTKGSLIITLEAHVKSRNNKKIPSTINQAVEDFLDN